MREHERERLSYRVIRGACKSASGRFDPPLPEFLEASVTALIKLIGKSKASENY